MGTDRHRAVYMPFRCTPETAALVRQMAAERHRTNSEVIRELVESGLKATGYMKDDDALYDLIKQAVQEVTKPGVERLAAISAKATQIDSAAFFMFMYIARYLIPSGEKDTLDEVAGRARQLGIEYLKLKDRDIDAFIREGVKKVADE